MFSEMITPHNRADSKHRLVVSPEAVATGRLKDMTNQLLEVQGEPDRSCHRVWFDLVRLVARGQREELEDAGALGGDRVGVLGERVTEALRTDDCYAL